METMRSEAKKNLDQARLNFGKCAQISLQSSSANPLIRDHKEMILGFGTACDWIRWSSSLSDLEFSSRTEQRSARRGGITETIRFNLMWTATNAIFSKDSIMKLVSRAKNLPTVELELFKLLYKFAGIDGTVEQSSLKALHQLLGMECIAVDVVSRLDPNENPTMWEVIDKKYTNTRDRKRGIGKVIDTSLQAARLPIVDGPTLIYGARNWSVHGMLMTSFFRGSRSKYLTFIDNITLLLSAVLQGAATNLLAKV